MERKIMNYSSLEKNIIDNIKEQHIKIGYRFEEVRLFYPLKSLNNLLNTSLSISEMKTALNEFSSKLKERYGDIGISNNKERFCLKISHKGNEYIHNLDYNTDFLNKLINCVNDTNSTFNDILSIFKEFSNELYIEEIKNGEFDYLIYFKNKLPDAFYYCISTSNNHISYHRFTKEDYLDFEF